MGMQCVDCHFAQDAHGNGHIYGEVAAAIEIDCADCHGTADALPDAAHLGPGGAAAAARDHDACCARRTAASASSGAAASSSSARRSIPDARVGDVAGEGHGRRRATRDYNEKAARAKLMARGSSTARAAGARRAGGRARARRRQDDLLHLPPLVDDELRRLPPADPGQLEDRAPPLRGRRDAQLRHLQPAGGARRHVPARPPRPGEGRQDRAGALVLGAGAVLDQRQPRAHLHPAAAGRGERLLSSQAFTPHYPHTERKTETKSCTDCHLSAANDNNAIMAQLLLHGTNFVNFVGFNAWVGDERHVEAVQVTEWDEPQAVIGSYLHRYAYPDWFAAHEKRGRALPEAHDHRDARARRAASQLRGEYLYAAEGAGGMRVYDVAIDRQQGRLAAHRHRAVLAARPRHPRRHRATRPAWRCRPTSRSRPARNAGRPDARRRTRSSRSTRSTATRSITDAEEGLILVERRHARRRRAAQQLPQARAHLEPGRRARTARAT